MSYTKIEEYKGLLKDLNTGKVFDNCFMLIENKKGIPKKVNLFFDGYLNDQFSETIPPLKDGLEFQTDKQLFYIWKRNSSSTTNFNFSRLTLYPKEVFKITNANYLENLISSKVKVYIQLTTISFFEHEMGWFEHDAFKNLDKIRTVSETYSLSIPNFFECCKIYPWIVKIDSGKKQTNLLKTSLHAEFTFDSNQEGLNLFSEIREKINLFLRVINFLNDGKTNYEKFSFNYLSKEDKKYECVSILSTKGKRGYNSYGRTADEYVKVINHILGELIKYDDQKFKIFLVLTWRHSKFKKESDISIKIALIHTTLIQLIKIFYSDIIKLSDKKIIIKILDILNVGYDDEFVENIIKFNNSRNEIFKNIKLDFRYDKKFNDSVKTALNLNCELLIKFFKIKDDSLKDLFRKFYKYIYAEEVKFDFMEGKIQEVTSFEKDNN